MSQLIEKNCFPTENYFIERFFSFVDLNRNTAVILSVIEREKHYTAIVEFKLTDN